MTRAEEAFKAWLRSPERVFVPKLKERYAQGRALGLSRQAVKAVLAAEPELTRLRSGRIPQGQTAFRLRFWREAEVDLGFLHWNSVGHGTFFLGKLRRRCRRRAPALPPLPPAAAAERRPLRAVTRQMPRHDARSLTHFFSI